MGPFVQALLWVPASAAFFCGSRPRRLPRWCGRGFRECFSGSPLALGPVGSAGWASCGRGGRVSAGMDRGGPVPPLVCGSSLGGTGASRPESRARTFVAVGSDTKSSTIFTSENVFFTL